MGLRYNLEYFIPLHYDSKALQKDIQRHCTFVPYGEESLPQLTKEDVEFSHEQKERQNH